VVHLIAPFRVAAESDHNFKKKAEVAMARWVFECSNCGSAIHHSSIPDTLESFYFPARPIIDVEGASMTCPDCGVTDIYSQEQLRFRQ
jgi:predicted RNA-binding Zn-ribbon protein involved in translation (DUF1610 family)